MQIGEIFRTARPYRNTPSIIDNLPNFFSVTYTPGCSLPTLDSGINPLAKVNALDGERIPAILISSSPHKTGSIETPWQDFFDPDNGHIHYFGDNKKPGKKPEESAGNSILLSAFEIHNSGEYEIRKHSVPIIFLKG